MTLRTVNGKVLTMKTEFFMPMKSVPTTTHQEKAVSIKKGKPVFYEPDDLKSARAKLTAHLGQHVPAKAYTGALRVVTKWCFALKGKHANGEWKTSAPDTHNMNKLLFDIMTDLHFWKDDAIVASEIIEKFWAEMPGIYISIEELV